MHSNLFNLREMEGEANKKILTKHDQYKKIVEKRKQWIQKAYGMNCILKKYFRRKEIRCEIFMKVHEEFLK